MRSKAKYGTLYNIRKRGTMNRILVLMSTYNGEAYLREQIDSILFQSETADILIRDDGSSDQTISILEAYEKQYPQITVIHGKNVGVVRSFFELLHHAQGYEYYAFGDQDDIWMEDKLAYAIKALDQMDASKPALYASCSLLVDNDGKALGTTQKCLRELSFYNVLIQNIMPGHAQVFNQAMADFVNRHPVDVSHVVVHDFWLALLAISFGQVSFDNEPHTYYRQHTTNEIGYGHGAFGWLTERLRRVMKAKAKEITRQDQEFYDHFARSLTSDQLYELTNLLKSQRNFFTRLNYLCHAKVYRQKKTETMLFYILYLLGGYRI